MILSKCTVALVRTIPEKYEATLGEAYRRGGHSDPFLHYEGNTINTFTSWTTDPSVAEHYANVDGPEAVFLADRVSRDALI